MSNSARWATCGRTVSTGLVCAALFCAASFTNVYADGDDHGHGNGRGRGNDHGQGDDHGDGRATVTAINIIPTITSVTLSNGQLLASGVVSAVVNGRPVFEGFVDLPVTVALNQDPPCPILNLQLPPIHLNLLGLVVDTSTICANITAMSGGGLLGDLLCSVANILATNSTPVITSNALGQALATLNTSELNTVLLGLTAILNGTLANLNNALATSVTPAATGNCSLLDLTLGPLNLNLLGLAVTVDNCAGGAAAVSLSGQPGALLGNLTCGLVNGTILTGSPSLGGVIGQLLTLLGL